MAPPHCATATPATPPNAPSEQAFGQELGEEPAPARPERHPQRDLSATEQRTREQKVGDVRARDEQHDRRDAGDPERDLRDRGRVRPAFVDDRRRPSRAAARLPLSACSG